MSDAELAQTMQAIFVAQLKAGYDSFTWEGMSPASPSPTTADEAVPCSTPSGHPSPRIAGMALRMWRNNQGLTQKTLGAQLGVSGPTISDWENNYTAMPSAIQEQLHARMYPSTDEASLEGGESHGESQP